MSEFFARFHLCGGGIATESPVPFLIKQFDQSACQGFVRINNGEFYLGVIVQKFKNLIEIGDTDLYTSGDACKTAVTGNAKDVVYSREQILDIITQANTEKDEEMQ